MTAHSGGNKTGNTMNTHISRSGNAQRPRLQSTPEIKTTGIDAVNCKQMLDVAGKALGIAADGNVGFRFMGTILEAVGELTATNPELAKQLAEAGAYWADSLVSDMREHQDSIETIMESASA